MNRSKFFAVLSFILCALPVAAQNSDWLSKPYGCCSDGRVSLNALDLRDQHKEDIKRLARELDLKRVEIVSAPDDYWYYSLQSYDGHYGVADQQGNVLLPTEYSTLNYFPAVKASRSSLFFPFGNKSVTFPFIIPATQACFIVSRDGDYQLLNLKGKVIKDKMGSLVFYNNYLLAGVDKTDIHLRKYDEHTALLMVGGPADVPVHIYTLNGEDIELPSDTTMEGSKRYYPFENIFMYETANDESKQVQDELAGSLYVDCDHPGARVRVDGKEVGKVPMTLTLKGEHNIGVEDQKNYFYRAVEHIDIKSGDKLERRFVLKEMPPKTEYFLGFEYGATTKSMGFMVGMCKQWGGYAKMLVGGDSKTNSMLSAPTYPAMDFSFTSIEKLEKPYTCSYTAGAMYRACRYVYPYLGLGYAKYIKGHPRREEFAPARIGGMVLDVGAVFTYQFLYASVGWSPMIAASEKKNAKSFGDLQIGVGVKFHINRKR